MEAIPASDLYQSNGWCSTHCSDNYAFAIVQYQECWCSDYIPAETTSISSCNQDCPGFPDEQCGSSSAGLFGYIALSKSPSGTLGAASRSSISSSTEAAASSTQVVSNPSPGVALASSSSPAQTSSSASSAIESPPPFTPFLGSSLSSPMLISTTQIFSLIILTSFLQSSSSSSSSSPDPSPVTVQRTVTALPSIKVISVVCFDLSCRTNAALTHVLWRCHQCFLI